jgi:hypothetical protein
MRKAILAVAMSVTCGLSGCCFSEHGFSIQWVKVPKVETRQPIIIGMGSPMTGLSAVGGTPGPVTESHMLSTPVVSQYAPPQMAPWGPSLTPRQYAPECAPCGPSQAPARALTADDCWRMLDQMRQQQRQHAEPLHRPRQAAPGDCP